MVSRTVIVTGAASPLGRATALRFSRTSDKLILTDPDRERGQAIREEVAAKGGEATFICADLHDALDVHNVMAEALDSYGSVDVLAHCAMHYHDGPFLETSEAMFDEVVDRNMRSAFLINRAVARQIIKQAGHSDDGGVGKAIGSAIVNVVSDEAAQVSADNALFAATQGAVVQLTKAVAMALSPCGARANAVGVGGIKETLDEVYVKTPEQREASIARIPMARRGEPKEVANAVHFLAASDASFITGQVLYVDGGKLAMAGQMHAADGD